jgi:hypothetical protein
LDPLDLRNRPPRSCYAELDGLMLMPRTIDKLRARLPGGDPGSYFINGPIKGISGYLLERLGVDEATLLEVVSTAESDDDVARWLSSRIDRTQYAAINETLRRIKPKHAENFETFRDLYSETLEQHPDLLFIVDIIEADDRRVFGRQEPARAAQAPPGADQKHPK